MTFGLPLWLLAWPALVAFVVVLHVRRRHQATVGSVHLWRVVVGATSPRPRVALPRLRWPLVLQLLAATLLVLALARPEFAPQATHHILLVDGGIGMTGIDEDEAQSEVARAWVAAFVAQVSPVAEVSIVRAGVEPETVAWRLPAGRPAPRAVARLVAEETRVDWPAAIARSEELRVPGERTLLTVVVSAGALPEAEAAVDAFGDLVEFVPTGGAARNVGLDGVRVERAKEPGRWRLTGTVRWFGDAPEEVELAYGIEPFGTLGVVVLDRRSVRRGADDTAAFEIELSAPGQGMVKVWLPPDAYPSDDARWGFTGGEPDRVRVVLVGEVDASVNRAFAAVARVELYAATTWPADADTFDLVVVQGSVPGAEAVTSTWWLAGGPAVSLEGPAPDTSLPTMAGAPTHPLGYAVDWTALGARSPLATRRLVGAETLASLDGLPIVQARTTEFGREVVTSFVPTESDWPSQVGFPAFVAALVEWVAPSAEQPCEAGLPCPLPARAAAGFEIRDDNGTVVDSRSPVHGVDTIGVWLDRGFDAAFVPPRSGRFDVDVDGRARHVIVSGPPVASVAPVDAGGIAVSAPTSTTASAPWRVLLAVAMLLVALDALLFGLGRGRFLHPGSWRLAGATGRRHLASALALPLALVLWGSGLVGVSWPVLERGARLVIVDESVRDDVLLVDRAGADIPAAGRDVVVIDPSAPATIRRGVAPSGAADVAGGPVSLAGALELAAAAVIDRNPTEVRLQVSGRATDGSPRVALDVLAALGSPVTIVPVDVAFQGSVIERVDGPRMSTAGERIEVVATVVTSVAETIDLVFVADGVEVERRSVAVEQGRSSVRFELEPEEPGPQVIELLVSGRDKRSGIVVDVRPGPRVRIVAPQPTWALVLEEALVAQGADVDHVVPVDAAWRIEDLADIDVVVLLNVPAIDLHSQQQETLQTWVRDHGGGLLVLGGENAFGPGGYFRTVLEELSPLSSEIPRDVPQVAMLYVLDRSGSMQQRVGPVTRLDVAKQATLAALGLLGDESEVGIIAFDEVASVVSPMRSVAETTTIAASLEPLRANGGTSIYPALELGFELMDDVDAATRHVVVFTDGMSQPADFAEVLRRYRAEEITVSFVAVGQGTDINQLSTLARLGGGAFHQTNDFRALPGILAQEALMLSATPIEEGRVTPYATGSTTAFLDGLSDAWPELTGYVLTTAKPEAAVHLAVGDDAPLLASWPYGLGRVVAFASHGAGSWARGWLDATFYAQLWSQVTAWLAPRVVLPGGALRVDREEDVLRVAFEAVATDGTADAGLQLGVRATAERTGWTRSMPLEEIASGHYVGRLAAVTEGPIELVVMDRGGDVRGSAWTYGEGPSSYRRVAEPESERLREIAVVAGALDASQDPRASGFRWVREQLPWWWIAAGLAAWTAGLGARYGAGSLVGWRRRRRSGANVVRTARG